MKNSTLYTRLVGVGLALWFGMIGCSLLSTTTVNDMRTEAKTVKLGTVQTARVKIDFGAGGLNVTGGANSLMDASFHYNVDDWQPQIEYNENAAQGDLLVRQGGGDRLPVGKTVTNDWSIQLNQGIPLELTIHTGAGDSQLDLSGLDLTRLEIVTGAGVTQTDLTGNWDHDVDVSIKGGVGELSVKLPSEMGVRVNMDTALVNVTANGLIIEEGGYVNKAFGTALHTLTLNVNAGVGSVVLTEPQQ
jgi:N-terminal domain of toast_rack, DUF2154